MCVHETFANAVNELYGRTFATWTLTTCALCLICAKNPHVRAIYGALCQFTAPDSSALSIARICRRPGTACCSIAYTVCGVAGATLLSFVAALVHFTIEVLVYKTMSLRSAANPLIVAGAPS